MTRTHQYLFNLVKCQALFSLIGSVCLYVVFHAIDFPYAGLLSTTFGFISLVPVIGPWFGLLPTFLVGIFSNQADYLPVILLWIALLFMFKYYWLWPRYLSKKHQLHPVLAIMVVLACLQMTGFIGLLLTLPILAIISVWIEFRQKQEIISTDFPDNL
jgi:predicted PurR-regulated permease PerM